MINHFNEIYECEELNEHEHNIIHLAWLWLNGCVFMTEGGYSILDEDIAGVSMANFEISIEDEISCGINLDLMYEFYDFDKMIEIIKGAGII